MLVANMIESYRLCRHRWWSKRQILRRRHNMNEFISSSSSTTKRTTKTMPRAQHEWKCIVFVIDDEENDKEAAAGTTMNEFISSLSSTTKRTTKTPPQAQKLLNCIGFIVIDNRANDEDAAASAVAAALPDDSANRMCHVPCAMYQGTTTDDAIYVIARATRTSNNDVECTKKHENNEKHERAIWLLCNWFMKEQYDCYPINTLKEQYDC